MSIRLISDLHLDSKRPDIQRAFLHYLDTLPEDTEALYILGDFFEAWVGDDDDEPFKAEIKNALKAKSDAGCKLYFMHGNRDFLVGEQFAHETGVSILQEPYHLKAFGNDYILMHGDSLCTDDVEYQQFKAQIRHPDMIAMLMSKSLEERKALAKQLREQSKEAASNKAMDIMDVNEAEVAKLLDTKANAILIHGHTHRPFVHHYANNTQRMVLGDWDASGWEIIINAEGASLHEFSI
jgi:UDP-2,3-diacylglucosamine hydrolase